MEDLHSRGPILTPNAFEYSGLLTACVFGAAGTNLALLLHVPL